jgi:hypothetical protein
VKGTVCVSVDISRIDVQSLERETGRAETQEQVGLSVASPVRYRKSQKVTLIFFY